MKRVGGFQVDHQLKLLRLLHIGSSAGLAPFQKAGRNRRRPGQAGIGGNIFQWADAFCVRFTQ
jgi:hypothetical protein